MQLPTPFRSRVLVPALAAALGLGALTGAVRAQEPTPAETVERLLPQLRSEDLGERQAARGVLRIQEGHLQAGPTDREEEVAGEAEVR